MRDAAELCGVEDCGQKFALFVGRRAECNLRTSGDAGRDGEHQYGRKERGRSAGDIEPDAADRNGFLHAAHARHRLQVHAFALLGSVEPFDIVFGRGDSRFKFLWDEARSLFDFVRGDGRRGQFYAVDLAGQSRRHRRLRHALHRGSLPHAA